MPKRLLAKAKFNVDIYSTTIIVIVMANSKLVTSKVKELCKLHNADTVGLPNECYGYTISFHEKTRVYYVLYSAVNLTYNTVTHEAHHLSKFIADFNNIKEKEYAEAEAFLNGYINDRIFKILNTAAIPFSYEQ